MGSHELNNNHRAIQAAQGIDPDTPEATRAREIAMFGAQETGMTQLAPPSQIYVPVHADGFFIRDNGGDVIAQCFTHNMAARMARLINDDARNNPWLA